jgi:hypothetical protein
MGNAQLLALVAVLGLTLPLMRMRRQHGPGRAVVETWEAFSRQQGLHNRVDSEDATVYQGTVAGRLARVRRSPGPDGAGLGLAMVTMHVPEAPFGLRVVSRLHGRPSKPVLGKPVLGRLQTGDVEFDAVFECSCPDPAPALRYLNSKRRQALMHLLRRADRVCLERRGLSASRSGDLSSKAHLANLFNGAGSAAERLG